MVQIQVGDDEGVHLMDMAKETCLIASNEEDEAAEKRPFNGPFTFLTELFFLTHRALELGVKVVHNQMVQLTQELNRIERAYQDAYNQRADVVQLIQQRMDQMMSTYLSYKVIKNLIRIPTESCKLQESLKKILRSF